MSDDTTKMVVFDPASMDEAALAEQKARLERLAAMPDEEIDFSDIPEITEEQWATAFRPGLHRPIKLPITIRIDADVVSWFKEHAAENRYQTEINKVLRSHVAAQRRLAAAKLKLSAKTKGSEKAVAKVKLARRSKLNAPNPHQKKRA